METKIVIGKNCVCSIFLIEETILLFLPLNFIDNVYICIQNCIAINFMQMSDLITILWDFEIGIEFIQIHQRISKIKHIR